VDVGQGGSRQLGIRGGGRFLSRRGMKGKDSIACKEVSLHEQIDVRERQMYETEGGMYFAITGVGRGSSFRKVGKRGVT